MEPVAIERQKPRAESAESADSTLILLCLATLDTRARFGLSFTLRAGSTPATQPTSATRLPVFFRARLVKKSSPIMSADVAPASALPPTAAQAAAHTVEAAIDKETQAAAGSDDSLDNADADADANANGATAGTLDPSKDITVFSSQTDFNVKHPLYSPWTLWFDSASKQVRATPQVLAT